MNRDIIQFDPIFTKHVGHLFQNMIRSMLLTLSRGKLVRSPARGPAAKYYKKLVWSSASFAFMADLALGSYGGALKMKEKLSGRYADILSWLFLAAATLKMFEEVWKMGEDRDIVCWTV